MLLMWRHKYAPLLELILVKVKICGLTNLEDTLVAIEAGVDMIGFNFYPKSPRYLSPAVCAGLVEELRERGIVTVTVGVFVNSPVETVADILEKCDLQLAQLHGDEPPTYLEVLGDFAYKAIRPKTVTEAREALRQYAGQGVPAPALLLDAHKVGHYGGTGQRGDWGLAAELARTEPILLAGGLTPDNVSEALSQVRPWGVDVASGVERAPGSKDHQKIEAFLRAVRQFEDGVSKC